MVPAAAAQEEPAPVVPAHAGVSVRPDPARRPGQATAGERAAHRRQRLPEVGTGLFEC